MHHRIEMASGFFLWRLGVWPPQDGTDAGQPQQRGAVDWAEVFGDICRFFHGYTIEKLKTTPLREINGLLKQISRLRAEESLLASKVALFGNMGASGESLQSTSQLWLEQAGIMPRAQRTHDQYGRKILNVRDSGMSLGDSVRSWFSGLNSGQSIRGIG